MPPVYGDKISENPAGWEFNCRKSRGSGRKNREPTAGDVCVSLRYVERSFSLSEGTRFTQLSAEPVDNLRFLHRLTVHSMTSSIDLKFSFFDRILLHLSACKHF